MSVDASDVAGCNTAFVFTLKALMFPVISVITLLLCLQVWRQPLIGSYFLVAVLGFAGVGEFIEMDKIEYRSSFWTAMAALRYILVRWIALSICILGLLHLSRTGVTVADRPLLAWVIINPFILWTMYIGSWKLLLQLGPRYMSVRNAVIVGRTEQGMQLHQMLAERPLLGVRCVGFFDGNSNDHSLNGHSDDARLGEVIDGESFELEPNRANLAIRNPYLVRQELVKQQNSEFEESDKTLGTLQQVAAFVRTHNINLVYITLPMSRSPQLMKLLAELHDTVASIYFVPDLFAMNLIGARVEVVHGVPLIAVCESPFFGVRGLAKRFSDLTITIAILLMIAPIMLAVAIAVKLSSPGPVIFKQRRYGLDGREIMVYKFRSMSVTEDGEKQYQQVVRNDSRVTAVGAFIRRTSLDELPQFLNVLEGSMSIVGPRPHAVAVNERYRIQIPSYMIRHKVKPGITGWAQVNGYRGGDDLHTMTKRIEFDLQYLANWSLLFDLRIIMRTLLVVLKDSHAF